MAFFDEQHLDKIEQINKYWDNLSELEELGANNGINDIFQDNGAKVLQQIILANLEFLPGREGNDAVDKNGVEWELKSVNIDTSARGFSTDHHTTYDLLDRFNSIPWLFSIYKGTQLDAMYVISPGGLSEWVQKQKNNLDAKEDNETLNNPKIPVSFVKENGTLVYPFPDKPIDPSSLDL
jgi:hypothetical protein